MCARVCPSRALLGARQQACAAAGTRQPGGAVAVGRGPCTGAVSAPMRAGAQTMMAHATRSRGIGIDGLRHPPPGTTIRCVPHHHGCKEQPAACPRSAAAPAQHGNSKERGVGSSGSPPYPRHTLRGTCRGSLSSGSSPARQGRGGRAGGGCDWKQGPKDCDAGLEPPALYDRRLVLLEILQLPHANGGLCRKHHLVALRLVGVLQRVRPGFGITCITCILAGGHACDSPAPPESAGLRRWPGGVQARAGGSPMRNSDGGCAAGPAARCSAEDRAARFSTLRGMFCGSMGNSPVRAPGKGCGSIREGGWRGASALECHRHALTSALCKWKAGG